jgi:hypothetical protein
MRGRIQRGTGIALLAAASAISNAAWCLQFPQGENEPGWRR